MRRISEFVQWQAYVGLVEDAHGNETESWADPVEKGVYAFDPGSTAEPREPGADRVTVEPTLYMPSDVVFGPYDRVTARGLLYLVEGVTREWKHPNGRRKGNVATLRKVAG